VYNKCVILLSKRVTLNAAPCNTVSKAVATAAAAGGGGDSGGGRGVVVVDGRW
jgi:hypothetical protein